MPLESNENQSQQQAILDLTIDGDDLYHSSNEVKRELQELWKSAAQLTTVFQTLKGMEQKLEKLMVSQAVKLFASPLHKVHSDKFPVPTSRICTLQKARGEEKEHNLPSESIRDVSTVPHSEQRVQMSALGHTSGNRMRSEVSASLSTSRFPAPRSSVLAGTSASPVPAPRSALTKMSILDHTNTSAHFEMEDDQAYAAESQDCCTF